MNSEDYIPKHKMTHEELVKDFILCATMDTNESGRAAIKEIQALKEQLATSEEHRRYFASHINCEHCKTVHKSGNQSCCEVIEKEHNALEKQLATTRSNYLFQISEQDNEIEKLNERVARMGEAFNLIRKNVIDRNQDKDRVDLLLSVFKLIEGLSKSGLESYDSKWMSGRLAEAEAKGMRWVAFMLKEHLNTANRDYIEERIKIKADSIESYQPNQSREKGK